MKRIPHERGGSRIFDPPTANPLSKYWSLNPPQQNNSPLLNLQEFLVRDFSTALLVQSELAVFYPSSLLFGRSHTK